MELVCFAPVCRSAGCVNWSRIRPQLQSLRRGTSSLKHSRNVCFPLLIGLSGPVLFSRGFLAFLNRSLHATGPWDRTPAPCMREARETWPPLPACMQQARETGPPLPACMQQARETGPPLPACMRQARETGPPLPACMQQARETGPPLPACMRQARETGPPLSACNRPVRQDSPSQCPCAS